MSGRWRGWSRAGHTIDARDGFGQTALIRAAHAGRLEAVEWLIDHGADLDHTSKFHLSALMLAVIGSHPRVARKLVAAGADTTITGTGAPGFYGKTAADLAIDRGDKASRPTSPPTHQVSDTRCSLSKNENP